MPDQASVFVFAHTGHALVDLVVFMGPVGVIVAWLLLERHRAKRRGDSGGSGGAGNRGKRDAP
jgi:hypothetical protein